MYINTTDASGSILDDSQKTKGHSFKVNATGLQTLTACKGCHEAGSVVGTIPEVIETIKSDTQAKWNSTNGSVMSALANYNAYTGEKSAAKVKIAQAYWNVRLVYSDESWGVHNPTKVDQLLDDSLTLANEVNASVGAGGGTVPPGDISVLGHRPQWNFLEDRSCGSSPKLLNWRWNFQGRCYSSS